MHKTMIHSVELILLLLLAFLFAWGTCLERQQQALSDRMIRLHVVANSDDALDQAMKLEVRDAVLLEAEEMLGSVNSRQQALETLLHNLERLQTAADQTLEEKGTGQTAHVTIRRELFGTRYYDSFALPGGYYDTLRVVIGDGEGHNWWCVVYPQICTAATAEDRHAVAVMGGLDGEQVELIEGTTPEYQFKFRSIEVLEDVLGWFRSGRKGIPGYR